MDLLYRRASSLIPPLRYSRELIVDLWMTMIMVDDVSRVIRSTVLLGEGAKQGSMRGRATHGTGNK